jgi:hypothetical protein
MRDILQEIRSNEDLPAELLAFIDSQLGQVSVVMDDEEEDDEELSLLGDDEEEDDEEIDGDGLSLDMPDIGEKPRDGFLTGRGGSGMLLSPGGGGSGLSLQQGGGLLSGGN